ncbi:Bug family tripartite tricarboxylate transporter substrate binding protein [Rhodoplanes sp. Z2-YC6860]|uniref:Bug family tripartite tricarboxylate transporter substrate binding protein n=1 Tax=Rhodoplanes sp. Z2-YC6860 TaxID=674703 RepID=UPI00078C267D|nr:tripartite tricarboxylate transporter substrate binding protein [Rhodoplanes sp. Z2-YC6860]AMN45337.1 extra-cytoplasmic solute receptor [Rhodoplanes sp. Z2-YC6860]
MLRGVIKTLAVAAMAASLALPAAAQTYPSQNINLYVAFPAGGLADIIARLVSSKLDVRLKQSVVVENRPGAGGNIAAKAVANAAPDGYTLLATTSGLAANLTASKSRGFEQSDLRPIAFVAFSPDVIAVNPSNPAKDLKEFIANAKEKSFTYGSAGVGTGPQIGAEYFFQEVAKVKYVHVPFQGGPPAITATLGNHVDALVLTLPPTVPQILQGKLRGLGVASDKRNTAIPDVPTYGEMGFPNVYSGSWVAFFAPGKTPDAIIAKLNTEINALMAEPDSLEKLKQNGFDPVVKNVAESEAYYKSEVASWAKMVNAIGFSN